MRERRQGAAQVPESNVNAFVQAVDDYHRARQRANMEQILARLRSDTPSSVLAAAGERGVYVNPQTLKPGQELTIIARLEEVVLSRS